MADTAEEPKAASFEMAMLQSLKNAREIILADSDTIPELSTSPSLV